MAYFSNGTEGMGYEEKYCSKCVHGAEDKFCPVWKVHFVFNYDQCNENKIKQILDTLIPRKEIENEQCSMFLAEKK